MVIIQKLPNAYIVHKRNTAMLLLCVPLTRGRAKSFFLPALRNHALSQFSAVRHPPWQQMCAQLWRLPPWQSSFVKFPISCCYALVIISPYRCCECFVKEKSSMDITINSIIALGVAFAVSILNVTPMRQLLDHCWHREVGTHQCWY